MSSPEENVAEIRQALRQHESADLALAQALWENKKNQYFRMEGCRSVAEWLRVRFVGTSEEGTAKDQARTVQRLIKEYELALEIPVFREAFDSISRSNRRLIAQVLTVGNADDWIDKAKRLPFRDLEALVMNKPGAERGQRTYKSFALAPDQLELLQRALGIARKLHGDDPKGPESPLLELICQEFIGTYGHEDGFKTFSTAECPACGRFCALDRTPEYDEAAGDYKLVAFVCRGCQAPVRLLALPEEGEAGDAG